MSSTVVFFSVIQLKVSKLEPNQIMKGVDISFNEIGVDYETFKKLAKTANHSAYKRNNHPECELNYRLNGKGGATFWLHREVENP